jgi:hypothetical protein
MGPGDGRRRACQIGSERLIMPDARPCPAVPSRCRCSGRGSSVPLQARGHWFEPSCAHQVRSLFRNAALVAKSKRRAKGLTAGDVQETLDALAGRLSTRSLQIVRNCPERAIRHAEVRDLVGLNVAALVKAPAGRSGRPSKNLILEQAQDLLRRWRFSAVRLRRALSDDRTEDGRASGAQMERG